MIPSYLARIGRRKPFRVAVVYAVLSSLVLLYLYVAPSAADVPGSADIPLYLELGFPLIVFFAWVFDRPRIVAAGDGPSADELKRLKRGRKVHYVIIVLLLAAVGLMAWGGADVRRLLPFVPDQKGGSVAVLAFTNASPNPVVEYLGDGMAEELKHLLERVPQLDVAAGGYSFRYKGDTRTPAEIGAELGVDAVLAGDIEVSGDTLRVDATLSAVKGDAAPLWTFSRQRSLDALEQTQAEIAAGVVDTLAGGFLGAAAPAVERVDAEAFRDYLKARHVERLGARRSGKFIRELYEDALERDPSFARAYSDYADFLFWSGIPMGLSERESYSLASDLLRRVNRIDPERTRPTRWVDAALRANIAGDWEGEEYALRQHMRMASAYRPADHSVYERYGQLLMRGGLFYEALDYYALAEAADPGNAAVIRNEGLAHLALGKFGEARAEFERGLTLDPSMFDLHQLRAVALLGVGNIDEAAEEWDYFYASQRVRLHFARGDRDLALADLQQAIDGLDPDSNLAGIRSEEIGNGFALLGEADRAFQWWGRAMESGLPRMQGIRYSRVPTKISDDPRYRELLQTLGLTDEWRKQLCERAALLTPVTGVEPGCLDVLVADEAMASEAGSRLVSAHEPTDQMHDDGERHGDQDHRRQGEVEGKAVPLDPDVAGQAAEPRQPTGPHQ